MVNLRLQYGSRPARFHKGWWMESLRNFLLVAVVTVLIWVYADMEFTDTIELRATVRLSTARSKDLVLLSQPQMQISFRVRGNRSNLEKLRSEVDNRAELVYDIPDDLGRGSSPIQVADVLRGTTSLARAGLTFVSSSPQAVRVQLDQLVTCKLPVTFDYDSRYALVGSAVVDPSEVTARITETNWQAITQALKGATPALKTRRFDLQNATADKPTTVTAEIMPGVETRPGTPPVPVEQLDPKSVSVTFQLARSTDVATLTISVRVLTPPSWTEDSTWKDYNLVRKDPLEWRKQIQITGPKQDIDRLRRPEDVQANVQAYVVLTDDDKKPVESWLARDVVVRFADDLQVKLVGEKPTVSFKLVKRAPSPMP